MSDPRASRAASRRLRREARTVEVMIRMNCRDNHPLESEQRLCPGCSALVDYALERVSACRFGETKPTCVRCTVHCFRQEMRERIRAAMRHSGPRMTYRHPYLAVRHMLDRRGGPAG